MISRNLLNIIAAAGLLLTILPSFLVFSGQLTLPQHYSWMLVGTVLWFSARIARERLYGDPTD